MDSMGAKHNHFFELTFESYQMASGIRIHVIRVCKYLSFSVYFEGGIDFLWGKEYLFR